MKKNQETAELLYHIAELLELKGENTFKIRAYNKAARAVESLSTDIQEIYAAEELESITGVGSAIAEKIGEYLKNGRLGYYDDLFKEIPAGLSEMLKIPGLGPKTVQLVYQKLSITDLNTLEQAARSHRLRRLPGFGQTKEKNIIKAIERYRQRSGRIPFGKAYGLVDEIFQFMDHYVKTGTIVPAGSLRRGRDTVGDIDLLAIHDNPVQLINAFVGMPIVGQVLGKGKTKVTIVTKDAVQVDLRILEARSYGTSLQYFTGSKEHNVKLRSIALKQGLSLSEYALEDVGNGEKIYCDNENEVYQHLGLPYIPPELREDAGEIEAALAGSLPRLITLQDIKGDLHVHSDWSDGVGSIETLADAAQQRGYRYLGITDHSRSLGIARGLAEDKLREQIQEISALNDELENFNILSGTEVDIKADGSIDLPDSVLEMCDVVVAAVHSAHQQDERTMTGRIIKGMENPNVDILAHPSGRLIGEREPYAVNMTAVLEAAERIGTALEINAHPSRLDLADVYVRKAKELGVRVAIGTDAHSSSGLNMMRFGVMVARRGWLEKEDVINTREADSLPFKP
ncbi:MAG: DNA polymerase/3'-5' exonuclease PolX [Methanosarcinales archaeon]|nr:DNA polymerase/3'-5' exonuclease PolX [Methanosarcinales archaeon]